MGISEDVFCTRMAEFNIERTSQPEEWPEWTIGTPLGKLEESYILQTWLYTGYRFTKTTEVLEEPMWRVGATVYNRPEYSFHNRRLGEE